VSMKPAKKQVLGLFAASDASCSGDPLATTSADFRARALETALAQVKPGSSSTFQIQVVRDF
jgi:hypothetical protein